MFPTQFDGDPHAAVKGSLTSLKLTVAHAATNRLSIICIISPSAVSTSLKTTQNMFGCSFSPTHKVRQMS